MCLHVVFNLARKIYRNLVSFHYFLNYRNPKSWTWLMWADNYLIVAWVCESEGFLNVWGTCRLLWKLSILCICTSIIKPKHILSISVPLQINLTWKCNHWAVHLGECFILCYWWQAIIVQDFIFIFLPLIWNLKGK
jgi:hypothetical protein